jgi:multidrug resistance efflux pump
LFDADRVPEVQNAVATLALAESEFARVQSLLDQRVVSQAEFDTRRTQLEVAKRQVDVAKNGAAQQFQALQAARARGARPKGPGRHGGASAFRRSGR